MVPMGIICRTAAHAGAAPGRSEAARRGAARRKPVLIAGRGARRRRGQQGGPRARGR